MMLKENKCKSKIIRKSVFQKQTQNKNGFWHIIAKRFISNESQLKTFLKDALQAEGRLF
jgi:hypothetical protein